MLAEGLDVLIQQALAPGQFFSGCQFRDRTRLLVGVEGHLAIDGEFFATWQIDYNIDSTGTGLGGDGHLLGEICMLDQS